MSMTRMEHGDLLGKGSVREDQSLIWYGEQKSLSFQKNRYLGG